MILHTLIIHYNVGIMSRDLPSQLPSHFLTKMSSHKTLPWLTCTQKFMANGWIRRQSLKRHFTIFLPLFALTKPSSMLTGHGIGIAPLLLNMKRVATSCWCALIYIWIGLQLYFTVADKVTEICILAMSDRSDLSFPDDDDLQTVI